MNDTKDKREPETGVRSTGMVAIEQTPWQGADDSWKGNLREWWWWATHPKTFVWLVTNRGGSRAGKSIKRATDEVSHGAKI